MTTDVNIVYVGIDGGTERHQACALDGARQVLGERAFDHAGAGLTELVDWLLSFIGGEADRLRVAIECPHGAVVDALLAHGVQVQAINPKQLDRFRDRHTMAGAKDDRCDAFVLADSPRTDPQAFAALRAEAEEITELREWRRADEDLRVEENALLNRLREQLWRSWPALLRLAADRPDPFLWSLWELAPTPAAGRQLSREAIESLLKQHRVRRVNVEDVQRILAEMPLPAAAGTAAAAAQRVRLLIPRLRLVYQQRRECGQAMKAILAQLAADEEAVDEAAPDGERKHRDAQILASLPGVGRVVLATLLAEASPQIAERRRDSLRALSGLAPVTRQSGKQRLVAMRRACHARLRAQGHQHSRALRGVVDRLLDIASEPRS